MTTSSYPLAVRLTAERIAGEWLREHDYCDCAINEQRVARRLLPALAMFEREVTRDTAYDRDELRWRFAIYLTRAHDDLSKGLHRRGASTAPSAYGRDHGGDGKDN